MTLGGKAQGPATGGEGPEVGAERAPRVQPAAEPVEGVEKPSEAGERRAPGPDRPQRGAARVDGILVVDKPVGPTSHDVVALVRRLAGTRKIGHGGTLDPFASGVLPLYLGLGTRIVEFHLGAKKAYRATVCFGASSTTDDLEGELTPADAPAPDRAAVEAALAGFVGTLEQRPPAFSARKVGGRRAYALARRGETPQLTARTVTFHDLHLVRWDASDPERPTAVVDVTCSAGTYIRALARDLGAAVGNGGYLGALRRTASGPFTLDDARPLDAIREAASGGTFAALLLPVDAGLDGIPALTLGPEELWSVARGGWVGAASRLPEPVAPPPEGTPADRIRLLAPDGSLVAIARRTGSRLVPDKVLVGREPADLLGGREAADSLGGREAADSLGGREAADSLGGREAADSLGGREAAD